MTELTPKQIALRHMMRRQCEQTIARSTKLVTALHQVERVLGSPSGEKDDEYLMNIMFVSSLSDDQFPMSDNDLLNTYFTWLTNGNATETDMTETMWYQNTEDEAMKIYDSGEWQVWTDDYKFVYQITQDRLCMPWDAFHAATETALGRSVWTHEFAEPKSLLREYLGQIERPTMEEVFSKLPQDKTIAVDMDDGMSIRMALDYIASAAAEKKAKEGGDDDGDS